ncbi:alpha/beta fold hydrolase [Tropicimonas sp. IMCC34043]|uniref:alpha/beta fold hydrolase n=1 Tax=Tropicimonas sp. IMCC34043 TaxID=2248760 RepID=UPI000E26C648|nr:alpha/beta hydrolase [Tropicimonas sp. IMCC34043]
MTEYFNAPDGLRLAYDDQGAGHPILCLAGLTRNMADFDPVVATFADRARIIRMDYRGRGLSEFDPDHSNYNIIHEGRDALALLDRLGIERATILGTSRGGLIALSLAVSHADRLLGAILVDIGPAVETPGLAHIMAQLGSRPGFRSYEDAADRLPEQLAPRFRNVPRDTWLAFARHRWIETPEGLDLRYDPALRQAVIEQTANGALSDLWPLFDALTPLPMALIRGANSDVLAAETAAEMIRRKPDIIFAAVPDRGHVPFLDEAEAIGAIETYLARVTQPMTGPVAQTFAGPST